jgi:CBS domain-containing protein
LKRLALLTIDDIELIDGPVVDVDSTRDAAERVMGKFGTDWVGVRDGDRLLGWVWRRDLGSSPTVGDAPRQRFMAAVPPGAPLRETLDAIVLSQTNVAVVVDDDNRYLGMVMIDQISEGIR